MYKNRILKKTFLSLLFVLPLCWQAIGLICLLRREYLKWKKIKNLISRYCSSESSPWVTRWTAALVCDWWNGCKCAQLLNSHAYYCYYYYRCNSCKKICHYYYYIRHTSEISFKKYILLGTKCLNFSPCPKNNLHAI